MKKENHKTTNSGTEWIEEIPEGWKRLPLKRIFTIHVGKDHKGAQAGNGYPVIGPQGQFAYATGYHYDGEALVFGRKGTIDKPMYLNGKFWAAENVFYAIPNENVCCKYMYYQALLVPFALFSTGTTIPNITKTELGNIPMCIPPLPEQQAIANYLDQKIGEINKFLHGINEKMGNLKAYHQSIISETITQGLNPDNKMKDSGLEWMGEVPEGWEKNKLKYLLEQIRTSSISGRRIGFENIESSTGRFVETNSESNGKGIQFTNGDIVYGKFQPHLQKVWEAEFEGNAAANDFYVFRCKENAIPAFVKYLMLSDNFTSVVSNSTYGDRAQRVSSNFILDLPWYLPPLAEQQTIANFLDEKAKEITALLKEFETLTVQLNELKQATISEAVTGIME